jgi:hypothetical protein
MKSLRFLLILFLIIIYNPAYAGFIPGNIITASILKLQPIGTQSVTAITDTIGIAYSTVNISSDADYILTSTPTIAAGTDGQLLILQNTGSFQIDLQDDSVLAGSDVFQGGTSGVLSPGETMTLQYNSTVGGWVIQSHPNLQAVSAGGTGGTVDVRNTSGATIAKGAPVYITGYNAGQGRATIGLSDADDPTKMPAIGCVSESILNNKNGTVISSGVLTGIDTSGGAVESGAWVSTTAGAVVYTRPAIDEVQRIGTVLRSHASQGSMIIIGAGRSNDVPYNLPAAINTAYATVASHATTSAIWAAAGNIINFTGTETITDFPAADQAGAQRTLICAGAVVFTHAGNITIQGGVTYTASANDKVIVTAISTTTFHVNILPQDGLPVASASVLKTYLGIDYSTQIGAGGMIPSTTNGPASATWEYGTNDIDLNILAFDGGAIEERAQFTTIMPADWDRSTVKIKFYWTNASGASAGDTVEWGIKAGAISNGDPIDSTLGTAVTISDTLIADAYLQITSATAVMTVGGTPALGDMIQFEVYRNTDGTDDMTEDAWLLSVLIQYKKTNVVAGW